MGSTRIPLVRIDVLIAEKGLAESRVRAQSLIMAGLVYANGLRVDKAGTKVPVDVDVQVRNQGSQYVSRGGDKLAGALVSFAPLGLTVDGAVAADFGASTGGFVDCLLQNGAKRVYAIDVGQGLLHEKLRADSRVVVMDRVNARYVTSESLGELVDLVVIDASFIGLAKLLGAARGVLREGGGLVALVKPQFEAGRREVSRGRGVIRDEGVRERVVAGVVGEILGFGFRVVGEADCVLAGPRGNRGRFVFGRVGALGGVGGGL
ncbi:MAG: TlyA family RNA methyltransferase [Polyangiaceae bacterium]|nr:TlyA family RNA methyltransferase [Polyangiaceae bacterium]